VPYVRKPPARVASEEWGPWTAARFQTADARDAFLRSVADSDDDGWAAEAMPEDGRGAQVRWRPGRFLSLNDAAYAHGGRIVLGDGQNRSA
jgi:hypothetical protein